MSATAPQLDAPATLDGALRAAAERGEGGFRFLDRHERAEEMRFDELLERAAAVAHHLRERGVERGDIVAIVLPTSPEFLASFFGCHLAGATPAPLYPPMRLGRHEAYIARTAALLDKVGAEHMLTDRRVMTLIGQLKHQTAAPLALHNVATWASRRRAPTAPRVAPDDLGVVQFSSGTTRLSAGVGLTHRQLLANVDQLLEWMPDACYARGGVCWLPLYHDMGLVGYIFSAVRSSGWVTLIEPQHFLAKPALWLRAMGKWGAGIATAPDFAYALCVDKIRPVDMEGVDLSAWVAALNGAEPIAPQTLRTFADTFAGHGFDPTALTPVYGLAEASLAVTGSDPRAPYTTSWFARDDLADGVATPTKSRDTTAVEIVSVGRPLRGTEVAIRTADGRTRAPHGHVGQIWVRGPSITSGYIGGEDAPIVDGWLDTGDLGFVHEDNLYIHGRHKDLIVVRGRNHAPYDIERAVYEVDGVRAGCVVAVADVGGVASGRERLLVFVEHRHVSNLEELRRECDRAVRVATGMRPDEVIAVEPGTLPRTSSGKLRRAETLRRWRAGELDAPKSSGALATLGIMARSAMGHLSSRAEESE